MQYCLDVLSNPLVWNHGVDTRDRVITNCRSQSDAMLRLAPTNGLVWATRAYLDLQGGDISNALIALDNSYRTAPEEMWIAGRRVLVAGALFSLMEEDQRQRHVQDLRMMAASRRAVDIVASRYVQEPDQRHPIQLAVEQLAPIEQEHFLRLVRRHRQLAHAQ